MQNSQFYCYLNGKIIPESEATVSVFDIGLLRGFGIYEAMSSFGDNIFRLQDHLKRFRDSAEFLEIPVPVSDEEIKKIILELLEKNGFVAPVPTLPVPTAPNVSQGNVGSVTDARTTSALGRANIKFILTGGTAVGGIDFNRDTPTFYIFLEEWKKISDKYYTKGSYLMLQEHLREYPEYKTINYIKAVPLQRKIKAAGALDALYTQSGKILECTISNFFIVAGNVLITPKENILYGITRKVVIELARKNGILVEERNVSLQEVYAADECFLTSSFKDVVPVVRVGDKTIGNGKVGEMTVKIMRLFEENLPG